MSRRNVRENVFKLVYEAEINGEINDISIVEATKTERESEVVDDPLELMRQKSSPLEYAFNLVESGDKEYFEKVFYGIEKNIDKLQDIIAKYARAFELKRLYKVDKAILLVAIFEILYLSDIPYKVSVNEAVELAKTYSTEKSASYVNGILASVIRNMEELK